MTRKEQIKSAYKLTGSNASFYDGMMTYSTIPGKAICRIVWNMDGAKPPHQAFRPLSEAEVTAVEGIGCFCCKK